MRSSSAGSCPSSGASTTANALNGPVVFARNRTWGTGSKLNRSTRSAAVSFAKTYTSSINEISMRSPLVAWLIGTRCAARAQVGLALARRVRGLAASGRPLEPPEDGDEPGQEHGRDGEPERPFEPPAGGGIGVPSEPERPKRDHREQIGRRVPQEQRHDDGIAEDHGLPRSGALEPTLDAATSEHRQPYGPE